MILKRVNKSPERFPLKPSAIYFGEGQGVHRAQFEKLAFLISRRGFPFPARNPASKARVLPLLPAIYFGEGQGVHRAQFEKLMVLSSRVHRRGFPLPTRYSGNFRQSISAKGKESAGRAVAGSSVTTPRPAPEKRRRPSPKEEAGL
jgi:hypothetical protein